jgi:hypothetical protein
MQRVSEPVCRWLDPSRSDHLPGVGNMVPPPDSHHFVGVNKMVTACPNRDRSVGDNKTMAGIGPIECRKQTADTVKP